MARRSRQVGRPSPGRAHETPPRAPAASLLHAGFAIAIGALVLKAVVLFQLHDHVLLQPSPVLDDGVYVRLASRVAAGDLALGPEVYYLPPLYTYFMGVVFALTGGSILAVRMVQILLGAGAVWLVHATARRWFGGRAGAVAALLAAVTGLFSFFEILLLQTALDPFLTALSLYALTRALQEGGARRAGIAGVALGALALNRPNALPFLGVAALGLVALQRDRRGVRRAAALALGAALVIAPVTLRNAVVAGDWVLISSHGGLNLYIGNHAEADGTYKVVEGITPSIQGQVTDSQAVAERAVGRPLKPSQVSAYFTARALEWIGQHPSEAMRLLLVKLAYVFNAADLALNYSYTYYSRDESTLLRALLVGPWLLVPLGLFGFVVASARRARASAVTERAFLIWAAFVPVYALSVALFFVSTRYRLALLVPLCVTSGAAATWMAEAIRARRTRALALGAVALAALGVIANWPIGPDAGRAQERTEMVVHLIAAGDASRAEALLARTRGEHPQPGVLEFRVGQAYAARGDLARALEALERARVASNGDPDVRLVLGQTLLSAGRTAEALTHLQAARDAGAAPGQANYELARAYLALGRRDEARAALRSAADAVPAGSDGAVWLELGLLAMGLGDAAAAEALFARAAAASPSLAAAHENLGLALIVQDRAGAALGPLQRAIRLDPRSASAHYNLAVALAHEGRLTEAEGAAQAALRIRPDYPQARAMLAQIAAARQ